MHQKSN